MAGSARRVQKAETTTKRTAAAAPNRRSATTSGKRQRAAPSKGLVGGVIKRKDTLKVKKKMVTSSSRSSPRKWAAPKDTAKSEYMSELVSRASAMHGSLMDTFNKKYRCKGGEWAKGCEAVCKAAADMYEDLLQLFNELLPLADVGEPFKVEENGNRYIAYEFRGDRVVPKGNTTVSLHEKVERYRARGDTERVTMALLTVLACMSCRKHMCWIESYECEKPNPGHFVHALVFPTRTIRIACVLKGQQVVPASLLLTDVLPLRLAIDDFDSDGPLKDVPSPFGSRYEFALQPLIDNDMLGKDDARVVDQRLSVHKLTADEKLTRLFHKNPQVVMVDSYVALAPREVALAQGLNKVVCAEFEGLLSLAKTEGVPLILQMGGSNMPKLAKNVYMKPNFSRYGLRCGYLRWRKNPNAGWGKEQSADTRCLLAVQLP